MKWVSWLRQNWKELGLPTLAATVATFILWAGRIIILQGHTMEDMQEQIETLEKLVGCQEKEGITDKRHRINYPTLECIESGSPFVTLDTVKKWESCQMIARLTAKPYKFDWHALECIEPFEAGNAPGKPVP